MSKTFLYQINVTRDCNLRCTHCYIHSDVKKNSKKMILEQIEQIANGIVEHMDSINYEHAEIHFIGGEPTMLGLDFFEKAVPLLKSKLLDKKFTSEVMIVTNLLHKDILSICKLFDRVTTSYEPETRFVSWKGNPKPKLEMQWVNNVHLLQNHGIEVGVTTAMTKQVISYGARKLLDEFYFRGIKQIHFGFFIPEGDGLVNKITVFPNFIDTSNFLIEASDWYLEKREIDNDLWVNPFESMLSAIHTEKPLDDIVCPIISGSMDIHWNGNAAPCLEAGGALNPDWSGNVFETSILEVSKNDNFMKKVRAASRPQTACHTCDEYKVCKSGCGVLFQYWNPVLDEDCPGFKKFIKYVRAKHQSGLIPRYTEYTGRKGC